MDPLYPQGTVSSMMRVLQEVDLEYVWMPQVDDAGLGVQEVITTATFAVPCLGNQQTPLLITPGFGLHIFDGPVSIPPFAPSPFSADLPGQTYDAFLDAAWNPQLSPVLGAELGVRVGVYSDFEEVREESIRITGRGLVSLSCSPSFQVKAGILYVDRIRVELLPAGGVIWTPVSNPDLRFEILFPNPRLAMRFTTYRNTDWWAYLRGEYGGGSWTIERPIVVGGVLIGEYGDRFDYNDIRIALGVEWDRYGVSRGHFEVGVAFDRELVYEHPLTPTFEPDPTVFLGAGVAF